MSINPNLPAPARPFTCNDPHCSLDRGSLTEHLDEIREFVRLFAALPRQRVAAGIDLFEQHYGFWIRRLLQRGRYYELNLCDAELDAIETLADLTRLAADLHERGEHVLELARIDPLPNEKRGRGANWAIDQLERFVTVHGRLPRLFGVDEPFERRAGQSLNSLRRRLRGTFRDHRVERLSTLQLARLDRIHPEWRGPNAHAPVRAQVRLANLAA